jgi:hypothetical protein
MSVSVSGTSAVPVMLLRVLRRHNPFGRLTVPGGSPAHVQRAVHLAELVEDPDQIAVRQPARARIVGMHRQLHVGRGSSPSVELMVRSLAGEISVSG